MTAGHSAAGVAAPRRTRRWALIAVVAVATALRVLTWWEIAEGPLLHSERWEVSDMHFFDAWGHAIADGDVLLRDGFRPSGAQLACDVKRAREQWYRQCDDEYVREVWDSWLHPASYWQDPLYPYIVAAVYRLVAPDPRLVYALQAAAGVAAALVAFLIAESLAGTTAALAAGLLAAGLGTAVHYETVMLRSALIGFGALVAVWMTLRTVRVPTRRRRAFATGVVCGLLSLLFSGTSSYMLLAAVPAWIGVRRGWFGASPTAAWPLAALACAGVLVGMSPLLARNAAVGRPLLEAAVTPTPTFIMGNDVEASAFSGTRYSQWQPKILAAQGWSFVPVARATIATHQSAWNWAGLLVRKFFGFWHWYELPDNTNYDYFRLGAPLASRFFVPWSVVGSFALVGVVFGVRRAPAMLFPLAWTLATAIVCTVFFNLSRLRFPAVLVLTPVAGYGVAVVIGALQRRAALRAALALTAAVLAACLIAAPWVAAPVRIRESPYVANNRIAAALADEAAARGDAAAALRILERQLATMPPRLAARTSSPDAPIDNVEAAAAKSFAALARRQIPILTALGREVAAVTRQAQAEALETAYLQWKPGG